MNSALMFSSKKQDWETPSKFFDEINSKYHFSFDLAANIQNAKCQKFYTPLDDSLEQDWDEIKGNMFLNPPYGRDLKKWVKKAAETSLEPSQFLVMLIPARTDTSYWHDYIFGKAEIKFLRGRLKFEVGGVSGYSAPFPSALVIYRGGYKMKDWEEYLQAVLDYYDDKLSRLDKKTRNSPLGEDQHEIYDFYQGKRQEIYKIMHQTFFSKFGENAVIPKEYKRNKNGNRLNGK